jgi:hypothetical protein
MRQQHLKQNKHTTELANHFIKLQNLVSYVLKRCFLRAKTKLGGLRVVFKPGYHSSFK